MTYFLFNRFRLFTGALLSAAALLWLGQGCGKVEASGTGGDGETHFLQICVDECGDGYSCFCGVCTKTCAESEECSFEEASCVPASDRPAGSCFSEIPAVCDVACSVDSECSHGGVCEDGHCRRYGDDEPRQVEQPLGSPPGLGGMSGDDSEPVPAPMQNAANEPVEPEVPDAQCDPDELTFTPYGMMKMSAGWDVVEPAVLNGMPMVVLMKDKPSEPEPRVDLSIRQLLFSGPAETGWDDVWTPYNAIHAYPTPDENTKVLFLKTAENLGVMSTLTDDGSLYGVSERDWNTGPYAYDRAFHYKELLYVVSSVDGFIRVLNLWPGGTTDSTTWYGFLSEGIIDFDIVDDEVHVEYADRRDVRALDPEKGTIGLVTRQIPASFSASRQNHFISFAGEAPTTALVTVVQDDKGTVVYGGSGAPLVFETLEPGSAPWTHSFVFEHDGKQALFLYETTTGRTAAYDLAPLCAK